MKNEAWRPYWPEVHDIFSALDGPLKSEVRKSYSKYFADGKDPVESMRQALLDHMV